MKCENLYHEFKKYEGQPVKIYTDDGKAYRGIDLQAFEDAVRILDKCGRTILVEYKHITAVVEPMMELDRCCDRPDWCDDYGYRGGSGGSGGSSGSVNGDRKEDDCDE